MAFHDEMMIGRRRACARALRAGGASAGCSTEQRPRRRRRHLARPHPRRATSCGRSSAGCDVVTEKPMTIDGRRRPADRRRGERDRPGRSRHVQLPLHAAQQRAAAGDRRRRDRRRQLGALRVGAGHRARRRLLPPLAPRQGELRRAAGAQVDPPLRPGQLVARRRAGARLAPRRAALLRRGNAAARGLGTTGPARRRRRATRSRWTCERRPAPAALYLEAERQDGYLRDRNVFGPGITIEDDMAVLVATGRRHPDLLPHRLRALGGLPRRFQRHRGPAELEVVERDYVCRPGVRRGRAAARSTRAPRPAPGGQAAPRGRAAARATPLGDAREVEIGEDASAHGGGDALAAGRPLPPGAAPDRWAPGGVRGRAAQPRRRPGRQRVAAREARGSARGARSLTDGQSLVQVRHPACRGHGARRVRCRMAEHEAPGAAAPAHAPVEELAPLGAAGPGPAWPGRPRRLRPRRASAASG